MINLVIASLCLFFCYNGAFAAIYGRLISADLLGSQRHFFLKGPSAFKPVETRQSAAEKIFTTDMSEEYKTEIYKEISNLPSNELARFSVGIQKILTDKMDAKNRLDVVRILLNVPNTERVIFVQNVQAFLTPEISDYERKYYINFIAYLHIHFKDQVIPQALRAITLEMTAEERLNKLIEVAEPFFLALNVKMLTSEALSKKPRWIRKKLIGKIRLMLSRVPYRERGQAVFQAKDLISPNLTAIMPIRLALKVVNYISLEEWPIFLSQINSLLPIEIDKEISGSKFRAVSILNFAQMSRFDRHRFYESVMKLVSKEMSLKNRAVILQLFFNINKFQWSDLEKEILRILNHSPKKNLSFNQIESAICSNSKTYIGDWIDKVILGEDELDLQIDTFSENTDIEEMDEFLDVID